MDKTAWIDELADRLAALPSWGYAASGPAATEPTALAALTLFARKRHDAARRALAWLTAAQGIDGSLGVSAEQSTPGWPTSLAVLAWTAAAQGATAGLSSSASLLDKPAVALRAAQAVLWLLNTKGNKVTSTEQITHDMSLVGWPWVVGTHSWVEPTALAVLALKAAGHAEHARTREAVRLLVDRLLPGGGCNYGNTFVLGQKLLAHVQPSGLALWALAGESIRDPRVGRTIDWLRGTVTARTATASLCYAVLGLAAHDAAPPAAAAWLGAAYRRTAARGASPYKFALLSLAAMGGTGRMNGNPTRKRGPNVQAVGDFQR